MKHLTRYTLAVLCTILVGAASLPAQNTARSTSSSSASRATTSRSTTLRAASSGAKTTTTGSSQSGRANVDRRETTVSGSNVTNKGLTPVRTTSGSTARSSSGSTTVRSSSGTPVRSSSGTPVRSSGSTATSGTPVRSSGSTASSGSTVRSSSSAASSGSTSRGSGQTATTTVRQSGTGSASQSGSQMARSTSTGAVRQSGGTTTATSGANRSSGQTATSTAVRSNSNVTVSTKPQNTGRPERNEAYTDRGGNYRYGGANNMNIRGDGRDVQRIPPMDRPPIPYSAPAIFSSKKPHYYGYTLATMPHGFVTKTYWGREYYSYNGIWYVREVNTYRVARPPFGTTVRWGWCKKGLTSVRFSYYNSVNRAYSAMTQNYAIIAEQNRIIAENNAIIAAQNARLALNSTNANLAYLLASQLGLVQSYASATTPYYYQDGVFYTGSGRNFRTIVPPAGAIIASLPEDYILVTYGGDPFYRVENTLYRPFVVDGAPYFEVLGQFPY